MKKLNFTISALTAAVFFFGFNGTASAIDEYAISGGDLQITASEAPVMQMARNAPTAYHERRRHTRLVVENTTPPPVPETSKSLVVIRQKIKDKNLELRREAGKDNPDIAKIETLSREIGELKGQALIREIELRQTKNTGPQAYIDLSTDKENDRRTVQA